MDDDITKSASLSRFRIAQFSEKPKHETDGDSRVSDKTDNANTAVTKRLIIETDLTLVDKVNVGFNVIPEMSTLASFDLLHDTLGGLIISGLKLNAAFSSLQEACFEIV